MVKRKSHHISALSVSLLIDNFTCVCADTDAGEEYTNLGKNSTLTIANMVGAYMETFNLDDTIGRFILNIYAYQNGVYIAEIKSADNTIIVNKFIILK